MGAAERHAAEVQHLQALRDRLAYCQRNVQAAERAGDQSSEWYVRFREHERRLTLYLSLVDAAKTVPWVSTITVTTSYAAIAGQLSFQVVNHISDDPVSDDPFDATPDNRLLPGDLAYYLHLLDLASVGPLPGGN